MIRRQQGRAGPRHRVRRDDWAGGRFRRSGTAPSSEADPNALLVQFLVGFGSAVGHGPYFTTESDRQTFNLFAVIIGETAGGRKGTGFGHVRI